MPAAGAARRRRVVLVGHRRTARRQHRRRRALPHVYRRTIPAAATASLAARHTRRPPRSPCVRSAPPRATRCLFPSTGRNAAALADRCPGGRRSGVRLRRGTRAAIMVIASGSGCHSNTRTRTSGQPCNHASASNNFRFHKSLMFYLSQVSYMSSLQAKP